MSKTLVIAPSVEPVTLSEAKAWARVEVTDDDTIITALIIAARIKAEAETARAFITQTWDLKADEFADSIALPMPPYQSITSVKYIDTDGTEQTVANTDYTVTKKNGITYLVLAYGKTWPATRDIHDAVTIRFIAGYGTAAAVPELIKSAIKTTVVDLYENRESQVNSSLFSLSVAAENLLNSYRVGLYG